MFKISLATAFFSFNGFWIMISLQMKTLGSLPAEERPLFGKLVNEAKDDVAGRIAESKQKLEAAALQARLQSEKVDVTLPGRGTTPGGMHPVSRSMRRIETLFQRAGFAVETGPEIEDEFQKASAYCNQVLPFLNDIRYHCDKLELVVDDDLWPLAKYRELLFCR